MGEENMEKNLEISVLLDFYGDMLTEKQKDYLGYYYNDDLSLGEIAENEGITRQGVRDIIKRAEAQLQEMEDCLSLSKKFRELEKGFEEITQYADEIIEYNLRSGLSREINDRCTRIKAIVESFSV